MFKKVWLRTMPGSIDRLLPVKMQNGQNRNLPPNIDMLEKLKIQYEPYISRGEVHS